MDGITIASSLKSLKYTMPQHPELQTDLRTSMYEQPLLPRTSLEHPYLAHLKTKKSLEYAKISHMRAIAAHPFPNDLSKALELLNQENMPTDVKNYIENDICRNKSPLIVVDAIFLLNSCGILNELLGDDAGIDELFKSNYPKNLAQALIMLHGASLLVGTTNKNHRTSILKCMDPEQMILTLSDLMGSITSSRPCSIEEKYKIHLKENSVDIFNLLVRLFPKYLNYDKFNNFLLLLLRHPNTHNFVKGLIILLDHNRLSNANLTTISAHSESHVIANSLVLIPNTIPLTTDILDRLKKHNNPLSVLDGLKVLNKERLLNQYTVSKVIEHESPLNMAEALIVTYRFKGFKGTENTTDLVNKNVQVMLNTYPHYTIMSYPLNRLLLELASHPHLDIISKISQSFSTFLSINNKAVIILIRLKNLKHMESIYEALKCLYINSLTTFNEFELNRASLSIRRVIISPDPVHCARVINLLYYAQCLSLDILVKGEQQSYLQNICNCINKETLSLLELIGKHSNLLKLKNNLRLLIESADKTLMVTLNELLGISKFNDQVAQTIFNALFFEKKKPEEVKAAIVTLKNCGLLPDALQNNFHLVLKHKYPDRVAHVIATLYQAKCLTQHVFTAIFTPTHSHFITLESLYLFPKLLTQANLINVVMRSNTLSLILTLTSIQTLLADEEAQDYLDTIMFYSTFLTSDPVYTKIKQLPPQQWKRLITFFNQINPNQGEEITNKQRQVLINFCEQLHRNEVTPNTNHYLEPEALVQNKHANNSNNKSGFFNVNISVESNQTMNVSRISADTDKYVSPPLSGPR